jgi:ribosomal protein S18 acetylase RimI-like enzyme
MQTEYERNWGYREAEKRAEIFAPEARYLVAVGAEEDAAAGGAGGAGAGGAEQAGEPQPEPEQDPAQSAAAAGGGKPLGFVHLRYVLDEEDEQAQDAAVLYVYEIQLAPALQRRGVGGRLMALSERLALGLGLRKMKLTVFRTNAAALAFYQQKLGYAVDASSPSKWKLDECYEILSKPLVAAKA